MKSIAFSLFLAIFFFLVNACQVYRQIFVQFMMHASLLTFYTLIFSFLLLANAIENAFRTCRLFIQVIYASQRIIWACTKRWPWICFSPSFSYTQCYQM